MCVAGVGVGGGGGVHVVKSLCSLLVDCQISLADIMLSKSLEMFLLSGISSFK